MQFLNTIFVFLIVVIRSKIIDFNNDDQFVKDTINSLMDCTDFTGYKIPSRINSRKIEYNHEKKSWELFEKFGDHFKKIYEYSITTKDRLKSCCDFIKKLSAKARVVNKTLGDVNRKKQIEKIHKTQSKDLIQRVALYNSTDIGRIEFQRE